MDLRELTGKQKAEYNKHVTHLMQSWEWGEFRRSLGGHLKRFGIYENGKMVRAFQMTFHKIPFTPYFVGYFAKGPLPDKELIDAVKKIAVKECCAFVKIEPDILQDRGIRVDPRLKVSPKPLFTKYNFLLDLTKPEEDILKNMHPKTRYNIKIAQKHGVVVEERTDDEALQIYLKLYFDTTKRQGFLGHDEVYHRKVWEEMTKRKMVRLLIAFYTQEGTKKRLPLNAWMLVNFKDTLYYPYGGSSTEHKNVMAPVLVAWEAVRLGKKMGLKTFDLWGAADPKAGESDPYFGFTRFKAGLGGKLVEYIGTYDLVLNPYIYNVFTPIDKFTSLKVLLLKMAGRA